MPSRNSVGNDRFMNVASPGYTSETPEGGGGALWWPLRLNDMDTDAAIVVAIIWHEMNTAYNDARSIDSRIRELKTYPVKRDYSKRYDAYLPLDQDEIAEREAELLIRKEVSQTQYDYMRELLEAAYVC